MFRSLLLLVGWLSLAAAVPQVTLAQGYDLPGYHPMRAGSQRTIVETYTESSTTVVTRPGGEPQEIENAEKITFEADLLTLEVDARGLERKAKITIKQFVVESGGREVMLMRAGDVLLATAGTGRPAGALPFTLSRGEAPPGNVLTALKKLSILTHQPAPYATAQRRAIGDSWQGDPDLLTSREGISPDLRPGAIRATAKLLRATTYKNVPCIDISYQATIDLTGGPSPVPSADVDSAELQLTLRTLTPADQSTDFIVAKSNVSIAMLLRGKPGSPRGGAKIEIAFDSETFIKTSYGR